MYIFPEIIHIKIKIICLVIWVTLILESEMLALGWRIQSISSGNSKKEFEKHK